MGFWTRMFIREVIREARHKDRQQRKYIPSKDEKRILGFTKGEWNQSGLKVIGLFIILLVLLNLVAKPMGG
ncbi:MAG: hypothetical protein [Caudoviricetes sp.]|nr:MAG: hypothetical protein [Caudoviricetes sp.]